MCAIAPRTPRPSSRHSFGSCVVLPRAGLAGDDHDLVVADRGQQVLAPGADRQLLGIGDRGHGGAAPLEPLLRALDVLLEPLPRLLVALGQPLTTAREPVLVLQRELGEARLKHARRLR